MNLIIIIGSIIILLAVVGISLNVIRIKKRKKAKSVKPFTLKYKSIRIGIIGAGEMGTKLAASAERAGAKIVATHDIKLKAAENLASIYNGAIATDKLDKFFDIPMEALIVATIPTVRVEPIKRACEKKIHLLIEKPPAQNLSEGRECLKAIKKSGVIAAVGLQLRYDPRYEKLKQLLKGHVVHMVRTVTTINFYLELNMAPWFLQNKYSGGPITDQAIHLLDCVRYVLNNPKPTKAATIAVKNMALDRKEFDSQNAIQLIYELDNGVIGVHTNHCGHEKTYFDLEFIGPNLRLKANMTDSVISGIINGKEISEKPLATNKLGGLDKVDSWLKAIDTNNRGYIRADYEQALNTQALIEASNKSQDTQCIEIVEKI
jgi:predicted dehydrogenase